MVLLHERLKELRDLNVIRFLFAMKKLVSNFDKTILWKYNMKFFGDDLIVCFEWCNICISLHIYKDFYVQKNAIKKRKKFCCNFLWDNNVNMQLILCKYYRVIFVLGLSIINHLQLCFVWLNYILYYVTPCAINSA